MFLKFSRQDACSTGTFSRKHYLNLYIFRASCSILSLTALLVLLPVSIPARALSGRVINRTLSRGEPGCEVALIRHGAAAATVARDTTDAAGAFHFDVPDDAAAASDSAHTVLSTVYGGVD